jgi:hypothetical protein
VGGNIVYGPWQSSNTVTAICDASAWRIIGVGTMPANFSGAGWIAFAAGRGIEAGTPETTPKTEASSGCFNNAVWELRLPYRNAVTEAAVRAGYADYAAQVSPLGALLCAESPAATLAPRNVTLTLSGSELNESILSWDAPESSGGGVLAGFDVRDQTETGYNGWKGPAARSQTVSTPVGPDCAPRSYSFRVRAATSVGGNIVYGPWQSSNTVTATCRELTDPGAWRRIDVGTMPANFDGSGWIAFAATRAIEARTPEATPKTDASSGCFNDAVYELQLWYRNTSSEAAVRAAYAEYAAQVSPSGAPFCSESPGATDPAGTTTASTPTTGSAATTTDGGREAGADKEAGKQKDTNGEHVRGTARNDRLSGGQGSDLIVGAAGHDRLDGGLGDDRLVGGTGHDVLRGGPGRDSLDGGAGDDRLDGGRGADRLYSGDGNDVVRSRDGVADVVICGRGRDTAIVDGFDRVSGCENVSRD